MSLQSEFDAIVGHMRKQGCKANDDEDMCVYLGPAGVKCAVGCRIPEALYSLAAPHEGQSVATLFRMAPPELFATIATNAGLDTSPATIDFYAAMQNAHDGSSRGVHFLTEFEFAAANVAATFGLEYTTAAP